MKKMIYFLFIILFSFFLINCVSKEDPAVNSETIYQSITDLSEYVILEIAEMLPLQNELSIAVFPIEFTSDMGHNNFPGLLQDELISSVFRNKIKNMRVYERTNLNEVLKESELSLTGLVGEDSAVSIGEFVGVEAVLFGEIQVGKEKLHITLKVVNSRSAEILGLVTACLDLDAYNELITSMDVETSIVGKTWEVLDLVIDFELPEESIVKKITTFEGIWSEYNYRDELLSRGIIEEFENNTFSVSWTDAQVENMLGGSTFYEYHTVDDYLFVRIIVYEYEIGYLEMREM